MTKRKPDAVRGRPPKDPAERRVLVKVSLLPSSLDDLQRVLDAARRPETRPPAADESEPAEDPKPARARGGR